MITTRDVLEVARTARPHQVREGVVLDIDYVVKHTTTGEWDGDLYELGSTAAAQLANQFNLDNGLITGRASKRRQPRLTRS